MTGYLAAMYAPAAARLEQVHNVTFQPQPMHVYLSLGRAKWVDIGSLPVQLDVSSPDKLQLGFSRDGLVEILRRTADVMEAGNWNPFPADGGAEKP